MKKYLTLVVVALSLFACKQTPSHPVKTYQDLIIDNVFYFPSTQYNEELGEEREKLVQPLIKVTNPNKTAGDDYAYFKVSLLGENGTVIQEDEENGQAIYPGQTFYFASSTLKQDQEAVVKGVTIEFYDLQLKEIDPNKRIPILATQEFQLNKEVKTIEGGEITVVTTSGKIINTSTDALRDVDIYILYYDANGTLIDYDWDNVDVEASEIKSFELEYFGDHQEEVTKAEAFAYPDLTEEYFQ